ncbi:MAG: ABC transporter permease [Thermotoga sp.]|nr:MAG: ABC transporter permease [Thermotoga sp.]HDM70679.1 ABC transporter permease [Thermotogales bacterium]
MNLPLLIASGIRITTPILLAAMGGVFNQQVGLMNIGLEGLMLLSAFSAAVVGFRTQNIILGIFSAILTGIIFALLHVFFVIKLKANLIIVGIALDLLAVGLSGYFLQIIFGVKGIFSSPRIPRLSPLIRIGIMSEFDILVYMSWFFVLLTAIILYKTRYGLRMRACGENLEAAFSLGIKVDFYRYTSYIISGILCGLAGSYLVFTLQIFSKNITAGRGFIAFASVLFGSANPLLTSVACLIFGFAESLQIRFQSFVELPPQIIQMLPYLAVVIALALKNLRSEGV